MRGGSGFDRLSAATGPVRPSSASELPPPDPMDLSNASLLHEVVKLAQFSDELRSALKSATKRAVLRFWRSWPHLFTLGAKAVKTFRRRDALRLLSAGAASLAAPRIARADKRRLRVRRINDFISFDPAFCPTLEDEVITANTCLPLLRYKKRARDTDPWGVENHLVASWVSSGGRDYGFELRGTENWKKDGGAIASLDVAFSFDRLLSGENLPNHSFVRNLDKVTVNDPRKCEVLLRSSAVEFPMTFAARGLASVLPKKTVSANGDFGTPPA